MVKSKITADDDNCIGIVTPGADPRLVPEFEAPAPERMVGRPPMSVRYLLEADREAWAEGR